MSDNLEKYKVYIAFFVISFVMGIIGALSTFLYYQNVVFPQMMAEYTPSASEIRKQISVTEQEEQTISVVESVSPSVVSIIVEKELSSIYNQTGPGLFPYDFIDPFFDYPQYTPQEIPEGKQEVGGGTGFIISEDGLIMTNKHVIADPTATYRVILKDGSSYDAQIVALDPLQDMGVLKIQAENLPVPFIGDSDNLKIGQTVIAIGNSLSEYENTVTKGVISGLGRRITAGDNTGSFEIIEGAIQTDAAINPGNSGGPLLNLAGEVIGINTAVNQGAQSIGFAIPINEAKNVIRSIEEYGKIVRPFIGVRYIMLNEAVAEINKLDVNYGALVVRGDSREDLAVIPGGPADKAGIVENDILLELDGQRISEDQSLAFLIAKYLPGDTVRVKYLHKGEEKEVLLELGELTSD